MLYVQPPSDPPDYLHFKTRKVLRGLYGKMAAEGERDGEGKVFAHRELILSAITTAFGHPLTYVKVLIQVTVLHLCLKEYPPEYENESMGGWGTTVQNSKLLRLND